MIDSEPKSEDPEITAAKKICDEMRQMAKELPVQTEAKNAVKIEQFGNNFYILFLTLKKGKENSDSISNRKLEIAEAYGEKWQKFLADNADLVAEIIKLVPEIEIYMDLLRHFIKLYMNQKTRELGEQIGNEINLQSIKIYIWDKLNPLLKKASEEMVLCGINPEDFYT